MRTRTLMKPHSQKQNSVSSTPADAKSKTLAYVRAWPLLRQGQAWYGLEQRS